MAEIIRVAIPDESSPRRVVQPGKSPQAENSRALAGMLLAGAMAALLLLADQIIDSWSDGHLLAGWVALWTLVFAALALMAPRLRVVTGKGAAALLSTLHRSGLVLRRRNT